MQTMEDSSYIGKFIFLQIRVIPESTDFWCPKRIPDNQLKINPYHITMMGTKKAEIAQLVERWYRKPQVPSSNLGLGSTYCSIEDPAL